MAFTTDASDLGVRRGASFAIAVRDRRRGKTHLASVSSKGRPASSGFLGFPDISANGRFVTFLAEAPNLVSGDTNGIADVFVHDRRTSFRRWREEPGMHEAERMRNDGLGGCGMVHRKPSRIAVYE